MDHTRNSDKSFHSISTTTNVRRDDIKTPVISHIDSNCSYELDWNYVRYFNKDKITTYVLTNVSK